eukprot:jgi/Mesvir1/25116/Mv21577-RA.2
MGIPEDLTELTASLGDRLHLTRDKSVQKFAQLLRSADASNNEELHGRVVSMLKELLASDRWESKQGGLLAAQVAVPIIKDPSFQMWLLEQCQAHLEYPEARVRLAVAESLYQLAATRGADVYVAMKDAVLGSIQSNFDRDQGGEADPPKEVGADRETLTGSPVASPKGSPSSSPRSGSQPSTPSWGWTHRGTDMRHDTEGWKCLETSFKVLQRLMEGCGSSFYPHVTPSLRSLIQLATRHQNRFVREIGFFTISSLVSVVTGEDLRTVAEEIAETLARGLADNWSQVRYAASRATRTFLASSRPYTPEYYSVLLPPMCLNRYYVAEGVKLYSQETWRLAVRNEGRVLVAQHIPHVVAYYVSQSRADNHAVREAACHCMAELMSKIEREAVKPHVPTLLGALIDCFKDASWPVRDASCVACGQCVVAFPEESRVILDELYELWFAHLWDNIWSVRENSAVALGNAIRAYNGEALDKILPKLREMLPMAKSQPNDSKRFGGLQNVTTFGVSQKKARDNDEHLHTDKPMYSCGSLAPKLKRGGGCMDHGFSRDKEPWEASDGAVYLLRELAAVNPDKAAEFLPVLAQLGYVDGFAQAHNLLETIWKHFPAIAKVCPTCLLVQLWWGGHSCSFLRSNKEGRARNAPPSSRWAHAIFSWRVVGMM